MILPSLALLLSVAGAAVVSPPPDAAITAAPELKKRVSYSTLGWYSSTEILGTVSWDYIEYDADSTTYFTSGSYYRRCLKGRESLCPMYTSCSSGYMLASTTSTYCGMYISICSYNVMYSSYGGSNPKTGLWCDDPSYTGDTLYATSPGTIQGSGPTTRASFSRLATTTDSEPTFSDEPTSTATTDDTTSSGTTVFPGAATTTSASPSPSKGGSDGSKKAGIIAGATIGGIALLGAFVVAIIFILRRTRRDQTHQQPQPYMPQPPMGQAPAAMASLPEKHVMANAPPMQPVYQQPTGMDPRNSNYYSQGSMSPPPTGQPLPQYPGYNVNEMPTAHRG